MSYLRLHFPLLCAVAALCASVPGASSQQIKAPLPPPQVASPREPGRVPMVSAEQAAALQRSIVAYRGIVSRGGWPALPEGVTLRQGDSGPNVEILRRRLAISGDIGPGANAPTFDAALLAGVQRFQYRNGLPPTGIVHDLTRRALNVTAEARLRQLEINHDRVLELLPKLVERRYFLMNAASFELQGIAGGHVEVASRTIVGKRTTQTPAISARVDSITMLPFWHVPSGIARRAVLPAIRKDPAYLYKERMRVFSAFGGEEINPAHVNWWGPESSRYLFRQDPGPHNALGVIRFDMPNKFLVYLHDTPTKPLYEQFERTYSSGCIRTQSYLDAAEWAFAGQGGWTRAQIESTIAAGRSRTIKLAEPIPVHLIYLTAWVENGVVQFRNDVYARDKAAADRGTDAALTTWITTVAP